MPDLDRFMKRQTRSTIYIAARYLYGQPLDEVRRVALLGSHAAQLIEVPEWRLLLVRTGPPEDDPFYEVVADGTWLVYDQETGKLAAWDDDEFGDEFERSGPQPDLNLVSTVAAAIGQRMIIRASPEAIAEDVLLAIGGYWETHQQRAARPTDSPQPAAPVACEPCTQLRVARTDLERRKLAHWAAHAQAAGLSEPQEAAGE